MPKQYDSITDLQDRTDESVEQGNPDTEQLRRRREALIAYFRDYIGETFYTLGASSEEQKDELWKGLLHLGLNEEEIRGWEQFRETVAEQQLRSARQLSQQLHGILNQARGKNYISGASQERWIARFKDPALSYKAKEYFVQNQLPEYAKAWEREGLKRAALLKDPRIKMLTAFQVEHFTEFLSDTQFMELHFDQRTSLNSKVTAALTTVKNTDRQTLHKRAKDMLDAAVKAKVMSPTKLGLWMERIFSKKDVTTQQIEKFLSTELKQFISNWAKVRTDFDWAESEMKKEGVPQGFHRLTSDQFLALTFDQRESYVEQAKIRLSSQRPESSAQLKDLTLGIRHALDSKDWDDADTLLKKAWSIAKEEDRFELESMDRYLKAFREKEQEKQQPMEDAKKTLAEMRAVFAQIPSSLQPLYLKAMNDGYDCATRLFQLIYNRKWVRDNGYSTNGSEKESEVQAEEETKYRAEGNHGKKGMERIKLGVVTSPEHSPAVRRYDQGEWAPTFIHMPPGTQDQMFSILKERKESYSFGYWTTLLPTDVTYEEQVFLVQHVNWVLKRGMRKLSEQGKTFSLIGDSAPTPASKAPSSTSSSHSYSLSA